jgi:hypothetical protein
VRTVPNVEGMDPHSTQVLADPTPLLRAARSASLPAAAMELAQAGTPVFPCAPTAKQPLTQRGFLDATTDPEQVSFWWRRRPDANIGVPTGAPHQGSSKPQERTSLVP